MDWRQQYEVFMPHGMCFLWRPELMALHIISDGLIAFAYFTIPFAILRFVRGRNDLEPRHRRMALLFAAFIAFCGLTHVASIYVLWVPIYFIEGWLKALTAIVSVATAIRLTMLVPQALKLPSAQSMRAEIAAHRETMIALDAARAALAIRVDLTEGELRVAEQHQHQSNALLATVIEAMPGLIYAKDRSGRMLLANKATLETIGKDWPEVQGKRDDEFLDDHSQAEIVMANDRLVMESGAVQELEEIVDFPSKGLRVFLSTKVPFGHVDGVTSGLVGVSIDITERKRLARELLHVSRRSAMGEMATAIAHEINQPLASVTLFIDGSLALLGEDYDGPLTTPLALAKAQSMRAGEIIRRLRSFVSGGEDVKRPESLSVIVDEACSLALLGSREKGVTTEIVHNDPHLKVFADSVQIEQVVVNLVRNAMDAMGDADGARLRIETGYSAEGLAMLSVSDNGPGISATIADRVFEAFVSTKGVKGMGIGLSICRTIIESHGGKIWADPDAGTGATFRFTLPIHRAGGSNMNTSSVIQVVDDDEAVRTSLLFALQAVGFEVSGYFDAGDFLAHGQFETGILICDVRMPGMNGIELTHLLRERGSAMPIILTTGNASAALKAEALGAGNAAILEKPVELMTILAEIERITDRRLSQSTEPSLE